MSTFTPWNDRYFLNAKAYRDELIKKPTKRSIRNYDVLYELEGGMSNISIAKERNSKALVALKHIKPIKAFDRHSVIKLSNEATALIDLSDTGALVPIAFFFRELFNNCFIVLPYCAGRSLLDKHHFKMLSIEEALFYALYAAIVMHNIHEKNSLHLDLKPSNILFYLDEETPTKHWRLVIADFGISQEALQCNNRAGYIGTIPFASPEQLMLSSVDKSSDIWSYGATFYFLITGRLPFGEDGCIELERMTFKNKLDSPSDLRRDCPKWLSDLLNKALRFDKEDRIKGFDEVIDYLLHYLRICKGNEHIQETLSKDKRMSIPFSDDLLSIRLHRIRKEYSMPLINITFGWLSKYHEALKLISIYEAYAARKAVFRLDGILGDERDAKSLISQYFADPSSEYYQYEAQNNKDKYNDGNNYSVIYPLKPGTVRALLDLKCIGFVTIIEDQALQSDIEYAYIFATKWFCVGDLGYEKKEWDNIRQQHYNSEVDACELAIGPPKEMCLGRIAQIYRLSGEMNKAKGLFELSLRTMPEDKMLRAGLILTCCNLGEYQSALVLAYEGLEIEKNKGNRNHVIEYLQRIGRCYLQLGDIEKANKTDYLVYKMVNNEVSNICYLRSKARLLGTASNEDAIRAIKLAEDVDSLNIWAAAAEIDYWAKGNKYKDIVHLILQDPHFELPTMHYEKELCERMLNELL